MACEECKTRYTCALMGLCRLEPEGNPETESEEGYEDLPERSEVWIKDPETGEVRHYQCPHQDSNLDKRS